jgi:hypothetical protein
VGYGPDPTTAGEMILSGIFSVVVIGSALGMVFFICWLVAWWLHHVRTKQERNDG